jgi:hypothetical protein
MVSRNKKLNKDSRNFKRKTQKATEPEREPINEEQKRSVARKASIGIVLAILLCFGGVLFLTSAIGEKLGNTAENIALLAIAAVLVIILVKGRKE